jgi:transcriptional regulator of acetoin/glycerol metabolism
MRPEIELSWRRSRLSGLSPHTPDLRVESDVVDRRSRLVTAAGPVLQELARDLGDAPYLVILADRDGRIVDIPAGPRALRRRTDELGGVTGAVFLEETTGTNSLATAHELRRGVAVHGAEHYLESFKELSCYGHPITHPVTHRLSGVLDITCLSKNDSPLLGPLIARAAHDVQERLLALTRRSEQRMLAAFQAAASGRNRPVLVLGTGVVLANPAAAELLDPVDHVRLRAFAAELSGRRRGETPALNESVRLASGRIVSVQAQLIEPGSDGVLFEFVAAEPGVPVDSVTSGAAATPVPGSPVYVGGAPGTGRTTVARSLAGQRGVIELDAVALTARGESTWSTTLEQAVASNPHVLIVEHIELLPRPCAVRLGALVRHSGLGMVFTGAAPGELTGHAAALAAACSAHIELRKLTERVDELPAIVRAMLHELGTGDRVRFTPSAIAALGACPWPGNLRELHALVQSLAQRRTAGDVTALDLPARYRVSPRRREMTPLERAEHDALAAALRDCGGNKMRAAQRLGISRTTLYNRMRALHITG